MITGPIYGIGISSRKTNSIESRSFISAGNMGTIALVDKWKIIKGSIHRPYHISIGDYVTSACNNSRNIR